MSGIYFGMAPLWRFFFENHHKSGNIADNPPCRDTVNNVELFKAGLSLLIPQNDDQTTEQSSLTHDELIDTFSASMHIQFTNGYDRFNSDVGSLIGSANSRENMFDILEESGYRRITQRLRYLHEITSSYDPLMDLTSLKNLGSFFINLGTTLPCPSIGICPNTLLQAEWHSKFMSAVMKFLKDGNIRYATFIEYQDNSTSTQGTDTRENALEEIMPYIKHYTSYYTARYFEKQLVEQMTP